MTSAMTVQVAYEASLEIARGEFVAATGPSGSASRPLMHILGCLDRPTSGRYVLDGRDVSALSRDDRARVHQQKISRF